MEASYIPYIINVLLGAVLWLMRETIVDLKKRISYLETELKQAVHKEDFREFKAELFARLDRLEDEVKK